MAGKDKQIEHMEFMDDEQESLFENSVDKEKSQGPDVQEEYFKQNIIAEGNEEIVGSSPDDASTVNVNAGAHEKSELDDNNSQKSEPLDNVVISELVDNYDSEHIPQENYQEKSSTTSQTKYENVSVAELEEELMQQTAIHQQQESSIPTLDNPIDEAADETSSASENFAPIASSSNQEVSEDHIFNGQLTATDQDYGDSLTYSLVSNVSEGSVTVHADGSYEFNPGDAFQELAEGVTQQVTFTYQVQDKNGATDTQEVTITVQGSNDGPTVVELSNSTISENDSGAVVGELSTSDIDVNDSHTYSVSDERFEVVENSDGNMQLKLKDGVSIDYESESSVTVSVTSTDSGGMSASEDFTISVSNVDEYNYITGTDNADFLRGTGGDDHIEAMDGNDRVYAGEGNDVVHGGGGNDVLLGQGGNDTIYGGEGNDQLHGQGGDNNLQGGAGDDRLYGHTGGSDILSGGEGNDYIYADGNDSIDGGAGTDRVYTYGEDDVSLNMGDASVESLYAQSNADHELDASSADQGVVIRTRGGDDEITGSDHNDNIGAGAGENTINAGGGNDRIYAHSAGSEDTINAGDGDDYIYINGGDTVDGGEGNDRVIRTEKMMSR